jgi:drug/metabolite transporter (DMT)-like permease
VTATSTSTKAPIVGALAAAILFGASTPAAKALVGEIEPVLLAGLLYAGSGIGLLAWLLARSRAAGTRHARRIERADLPWLAGAVLCGGIVGPVLLMLGLTRTAGSTASLLLNVEGALTALIAWFVFGEHFDRRIALGMGLIAVAGVLLSIDPAASAHLGSGAPAVAGACLAWAIDNNLTRKVSGADALTIATIKGIVAGVVNLGIAALVMRAQWPGIGLVLAGALTGFLGYGVSLVLFVLSLRALGAARTSAYFATAPFVGATLALAVLGETPPGPFWIAAGLMAAGVWLHVSEHHEHLHVHEATEHTHEHAHDEHHAHEHDFPWDGREPHVHPHRHVRLAHRHAHYPDIHHLHSHDSEADDATAPDEARAPPGQAKRT